MRIFLIMQFSETPKFTQKITQLLTDDEYRELQDSLIENPILGKVLKKLGGARKLRHAAKNKGKSGGIRVIYYYQVESAINFLLAFSKNEKENLTAVDEKMIINLVDAIKKEERYEKDKNFRDNY